MGIKDDPLLIGQIALEAGFLTPEELESCLALQARDPASRTLGTILVQEGHLTESQLAEIRRTQDTRFERLEADPARGGLFGQLAVRLGYLSAPDLHRALRDQEAARHGGSSLFLGQLLLREKRLTPEQFLELLRRQKKDVASCPGCHAFYDLTGVEGPFVCAACKAVVRQGPSHPVQA